MQQNPQELRAGVRALLFLSVHLLVLEELSQAPEPATESLSHCECF